MKFGQFKVRMMPCLSIPLVQFQPNSHEISRDLYLPSTSNFLHNLNISPRIKRMRTVLSDGKPLNVLSGHKKSCDVWGWVEWNLLSLFFIFLPSPSHYLNFPITMGFTHLDRTTLLLALFPWWPDIHVLLVSPSNPLPIKRHHQVSHKPTSLKSRWLHLLCDSV